MSMKYWALLIVSLFFLSGCAYSQKKQFSQVQVGMDKDQVLAIMESPQRTQRWHGMDRWTYIFYDQDQRLEKEVHFDSGKASYVGETYLPQVSANEQDKNNEESNQQVQALLQASKADLAKQPSYEDQVRGGDSIRFVPQFEPIQ